MTPYAGYTVYVDDQTGWDELAIYTWGDAELAGWPGIQPTGTKEINGVSYSYFEMGEDVSGATLNLIFNNNGNDSQLGDVPIVLDRDFYFQITTEGQRRLIRMVNLLKMKASRYLLENSGWDAIALYYWGDGVADPGWPGLVLQERGG